MLTLCKRELTLEYKSTFNGTTSLPLVRILLVLFFGNFNFCTVEWNEIRRVITKKIKPILQIRIKSDLHFQGFRGKWFGIQNQNQITSFCWRVIFFFFTFTIRTCTTLIKSTESVSRRQMRYFIFSQMKSSSHWWELFWNRSAPISPFQLALRSRIRQKRYRVY